MALGDSISAALLAKSDGWAVPWGRHLGEEGRLRTEDAQQTYFDAIPEVEEYRGVSYAIGGDPDAITLPNIMGHYRNLTGASSGHRPPVTCLPGIHQACSPHHKDDGLNAAISGSTASALVSQAKDYLLPAYEGVNKTSGWAFLNVGIGANDICAFCMTCRPLTTANSPHGSGSPEEFSRGIYDAVQLVRNRVPRLLVNIMGVLRVSAIYELTHKDPYCSGGLPIHHLPLECNCALLPGPVGDYTRRKMDELAESYDRAVLQLIREWDAEDDGTFAAIWQPALALDVSRYPITAVTPADCFHPSAAAHERLAAGVWNRLTMDLPRKALPIEWEDKVWVRCLEEEDRILVRQL